VIRMEMRKEDAIDREGIEASPEHASHRPRAEVEDQRLAAGAHHNATLPPLQARGYGARSYNRDPHGPDPSVAVSVSALQQVGFRLSVC
jgi:hypothetical protein